MNNEKFKQTGVTVKIYTNNDGFWATSVMLCSIAARQEIVLFNRYIAFLQFCDFLSR